MNAVFSSFLRIFHCIYALYLSFHSFWEQRRRRQPQPLFAARQRIPKHLSVVLLAPPSHSKYSINTAVVESVANAVQWCRQLGVPKLTIYEEHGYLSELEHEIHSQLVPGLKDCDSSDSEVEYHPLTPPPSDYSDSRPLTPSHPPSLVPITTILISDTPKEDPSARKQSLKKRRGGVDKQSNHSLQLCLISREASKVAIAAVATSLARNHSSKKRRGARTGSLADFHLAVNELEAILESEDGLSPPDFMIVHSLTSEATSQKVPLELHGFPPWHIRLTEIFTSQIYPLSDSKSLAYPLDESIFCQALDQFAGAEMRFGK